MVCASLIWSLAASAGLGLAAAQPTPPLARHLLAKVPAPHGAVQIDHVFTSLSHPDKIVAGEDVTVVLNVRNAHSSPINLTYVTGMLASSQSFAVNIANFSVGTFSGPVQAGTDRGFEYKFATPERMPSRPFQVALTAFYDVDDGVPAKFATTFFNQTVQLMEPDKAVDTEALGLLLTFGAMLVAAAWFAWPYVRDTTWVRDFQKQQKRKAAQAAPAEQKAAAPVDKSDYLSGTNFATLEKKRGKKKQ